MPTTTSRKGLKPSARLAAAIVSMLVVAVVGGALSAFVADGVAGVIATAAIASLVMLAAMAPFLWWWRRADEAVREAHKWAWFWGGTVGTAVAGVSLITILASGGGGAPAILVGMEPENILYAGAMGAMLCQVVGYTVAWAVWWLQRR